MILSLRADGSGEHHEGTFILAGYLADTRDWFELDRLWCNELQAHPSIAYFKASECVRRGPERLFGKQFRGWTDDAVAAKRERLARIVNKASPRFVELSSTIRWDDYISVMGDDVLRLTYYHPYFLCFHGLLSLAVERSHEEFADHSGRIAVVLDTESNGNMNIHVETQYRVAQNTLPEDITRRLGSFTMDTDISFPTLQVADLLAWSIKRECEGGDSPVLNIIREEGRIAGSHRREWIPSSLAQFVIDTEDEFRKLWPDFPPTNLNDV